MRTSAPVVFILLVLSAQIASALEMPQAERLALESDPQLLSLAAQARAKGHLQVADAQLPDPRLQFGTMAVPLPGLSLRDEPMSQIQIGIDQQVPSRASRSARVRQNEADQQALLLRSALRELQLRQRVRQAWVNIVQLQTLIELSEQRAELLNRYSQALQDGLQNNRVSQQDVLDARARAIRVEQRLARLRVRLSTQRAGLMELTAASQLPELLQASDVPQTESFSLDDHPEIRAASAEIQRAEAGIIRAEAAFDPDWSWHLGVGRRIGDTPMGAPSETLLNARISIDLPLFTAKRQSQRLSAAREQVQAAQSEPVAVRRSLQARLQAARHAAEQFSELALLYQNSVLPASQSAAAAARDNYRNGFTALENVLAAEIEVLDVRNERTEALLERDLARVELAYLGGL